MTSHAAPVAAAGTPHTQQRHFIDLPLGPAENGKPNGWAGYVAGKEAPPRWGGESARQDEHTPGSIAVAQAEVCVENGMMAM